MEALERTTDSVEQLYYSYYGKLLQWITQMTRCPLTAEDIVQDTFLILLVKRQEGIVVTSTVAYLYQIARNKAINYLRRRNNFDIAQQQYYRQQPVFDDPRESEAIYQEIEDVVSALAERQKVVYLLTRELGWSREAIAIKLNIAPNTVKATMQKALGNIKTEMIRSMDW